MTATTPRTPIIEALLLTLWLGAALLLATSVAPAAFAVLPTRADAGALVGRVLPALFISGLVVAALVGGSLARRRDRSRGPVIGVVLVALACAVAQFGVAPRIERVRAAIGGAIEDLPTADSRRAAFGRLHAISVAWLGLAMLGAAGSTVSLVRGATASAPSLQNQP